MTRSAPGSSRWLLFLLLGAAVLLDVRTAASLLPSAERPAEPPGLAWLSDPDAAPLRAAAAGRYTTGREAGARILVLAADGQVSLGRVTADGDRFTRTERYRVGRRDRQLWLETSRGAIAVESIDALRYFDDDYRRAR